MTWISIYTGIGWLIRIAMIPAILRRQLAPGASVAWLGIIFLHPYIGGFLYMLVGETRLGPRRVERHREMIARFRHPGPDGPKSLSVRETDVPAEEANRARALNLSAAYEPMVLQAEKISGMPVLAGNSVQFHCESGQLVDCLIADIATATSHVHLLYYMFVGDATGARVVAALEAAARRGVTCRVLVDAVASRTFFHHVGPARRLIAAGVRVARALPVAPIQRQLPRMDLRNHRKLAVIDDRIAFAGSHNVIDPSYGGRRGAPWVDLTGRFTGPVVAELAIIFAEDWGFETSEMLEVKPPLPEPPPPDGGAPMQVVPTGPSAPGETFRRVFLAAMQCARHRVILTTPYFVPDEPTLVDLMMAADRGAEVKLLLPLTPDHLFTAAAGRAHFSRLLEAGVQIHLYRPGLLHSKTATVDDAFAIIGSANLDVRSFNLNFELSVLMYGAAVTEQLRQVQLKFLADCTPVTLEEWNARPAIRRYADSAISLLSPLL